VPDVQEQEMRAIAIHGRPAWVQRWTRRPFSGGR